MFEYELIYSAVAFISLSILQLLLFSCKFDTNFCSLCYRFDIDGFQLFSILLDVEFDVLDSCSIQACETNHFCYYKEKNYIINPNINSCSNSFTRLRIFFFG